MPLAIFVEDVRLSFPGYKVLKYTNKSWGRFFTVIDDVNKVIEIY